MASRGAFSKMLRLTLIFMGLAVAQNASAQFNGHNTPGDIGLQSGTQPLPGWYVSAFYFNYQTDEFVDRNGDEILADISGGLDAEGYAIIVDYASDYKIFGGNYAFEMALPFGRSRLEAPALGIDQRLPTELSDIYIKPISLGWYTNRADYMAGFSVTLPTGNYEYLGDRNDGMGMYSYELSGGTTIYLNQEKTWHLAGTVGYEWHSEKENIDARPGDIVTLEGGLGYSFMDGLASAGLAYFGQWKVTTDRLNEAAGPVPPGTLDQFGRHRTYGVGPEVSFPIIARNRLVAMVDFRWMREFGGEVTAQGDSIALTITFPVPGVPLQ